MKPVRVKICGIRSPEDGLTAAAAGADAVGLILTPARRQVTVARAREIITALPPFVTPVGVFVNASVDDVEAVARHLGLGAVQLHGDEPPDACATLRDHGITVIKAMRVDNRLDRRLVASYPSASAILLDTRVEGIYGGTGVTFPWDVAAGLSDDVRLVVAGGLTPENVTRALDTLDPYGVDVTSGVEADGRKDPEKVRVFVERVREWERRDPVAHAT